MQRRILHGKTAVSHRSADMNDGVTRHAAQSRLSFRSIDLLSNGPIEAAVKEHRVVMATGAPLAGPRTNHILHIFDRLSIELIVERSKMMRRAFPLIVNVLVAASAAGRVHEKVRRNNLARVGLRRRRREGRMRSPAFQIHREWRARW